MTCPSWEVLIAARDRSPREPAGWDEAVAHLDGCPICRQRAEVLDPTLMFRSLPAAPVTDEEVEEMRERVRLLVVSSRVGGPREHRWRWASLVAVAAGLLLAIGVGLEVSEPPPVLVVPAVTAAMPASLAAELALQPVVELLGDEPFEQVLEINDSDVAVVLLVDERFDV